MIHTIDNYQIKETDKFWTVISKMNNFLKLEPIVFENEPDFAESEIIFKLKKNVIRYCKFFNTAIDNDFSLNDAHIYAIKETKSCI